MPSVHTIAGRMARCMRRWLPRAESVAGAAAAAGDPSPLLDLRSDERRHHAAEGRE
jgi:hypothetical protein